MSNLDAIRKAVPLATPVEWRGHTLHLRKMSVGEFIELERLSKQAAPENVAEESQEAYAFWSFLLHVSLVTPEGERELTREAAHELVLNTPLADIQELGELCQRHSLGTQKKT